MSNLANQYISSSYQSVLNVGSSAGGSLTGTLQPITDGFGTVSPISLSTNQVAINGTVYVTGSLIPQGSGSFDLGSPTNPWRHGYFSSASIYLDTHQVMTLAAEGNNLHLISPPNGQIQMGSNVFLSNTGENFNPGILLQGTGPETGSLLHFMDGKGNILSDHQLNISTNSGSINIALPNSGDIFIGSNTGSVSLVNTSGSIFLFDQDSGSITIRVNANNTYTQFTPDGINGHTDKALSLTSEDMNIFGGGFEYPGVNALISSSLATSGIYGGISVGDAEGLAGSIGFAYSTFQSVDNRLVAAFYGPGTGNNQSGIGNDNVVFMLDTTTGATPVQWYRDTLWSGSLHQSGTFYADKIDVSAGSVVEGTGSYIATFDVNGILEYDTYANVASVLQPYLSGSTSGSYPTVIEASAIQSTGSISLWAEGGYVNVTGSINTTGNITWNNNAFNSSTTPSGALYFSSLNGGTLNFNTDGGEGDMNIGYTGWNGKLNVNGNTNITGSLYSSGSSFGANAPDIQINSANFDYPNVNLFVSESNAPNIFSGVIVNSTELLDAIGFAASTYNSGPSQSLTYNFYGPGVGNHDNGIGGYDNVVFQMFPTGSVVNWYRDTVWNGTLKTTKGFGQVELLSNQTLPTGVDTVITFNNDEFDPSGWYNSEFFYYQTNVAGIYQISYSVNFEPATGGTGQINVQVTKDNGEDISQLAINQHELNLLQNTSLTGTVFAQLNGTTDKLYLTAYSSVGQDVNGGNGTYFNIKLV